MLFFLALQAAASLPVDEIVVTATKAEVSLAEVAGSVDVVALGDRPGGTRGADGLADLLSGVQVAVANGSQPVFQIRGIGAVDHQALTPGAAAIYRDGVFLATNVQTGFLLYDVDRAEVLKGPQGTLYGRNASSGAIDFRTTEPSADQAGYLRVAGGTLGLADVKGAAGTSLSRNVSVRLAGRVLREGPYLENVATGGFPKGPDAAGGVRQAEGVRGSLLWEGGDARVLLRAHYEHEGGVNAAPRNDALGLWGDEISVDADGVRGTDNDFYGLSVEAAGAVGAWRLFSLTAMEGYEQDYGFDFDGTPAPFGDPSLNANLAYDRGFGQLSEEVRASRAFGRGSVLLGATATVDDFEQDYLIWCGELGDEGLIGSCTYVGAPGRVGPTPASDSPVRSLLTRTEQERAVAAAFGTARLDLTERLTLRTGLRFTWEAIEGEGFGIHLFEDGTQAYNDRDGNGPAVGSNRIEEDRLTGDAALRYELSEGQSAYVSVASGYKSGGFNGEVASDALFYQEAGLFGAEEVRAVEVGYKAAFGKRVSVELAGFRQGYDDPQARIFVSFPQPDGTVIVSNSLSNLDEARAWGAEAEASVRPIEGLVLSGSVTLLDTEISQGEGENRAAFDGNPLPFASDVTAVLSARYERPLSGGTVLSLSADAKHTGAFYLDAEGLEARRQDAYTTLSAAAGLALGEVTVSVFGRNLTGEDYAVSGYGFLGYDTFRSAPRQVGAEVRVGF